jgi:aspartate/methionine/tyrosine aminotransferase
VSVAFSDRTGWNREESALARAVAVRRRAGLPLLDLTASNPTQCGFRHEAPRVLEPLRRPEGLTYAPEPFGRERARHAVCGYYAGHGCVLSPDHVCLTTSTSEAYSFLFRLLCNTGDEVLLASPSYPLFDYLAALDDVQLRAYPLLYDHGWSIEPDAVRSRIGPRTRAIALVHPNNPTGHFVSAQERAELQQLCVEHRLALIVDEVFLDYPWGYPGDYPGDYWRTHAGAAATSFAKGPHPALTFVLSGMSKIAALPQMKLSWIGIFGPEAVREEARARLEVIADTFLSVSAPVQEALPQWFADAGAMQAQIRERVRYNLAVLDRVVQGTAVSRLAGEGGWYAVLRVPAILADEQLALRLLEESGVLVHPGSAFGFGERGWLVISLLPEPQVFEPAIRCVTEHIGR